MKRRSVLKGILGALFAPVLPKIPPAAALAPVVEAPVIPSVAIWGGQIVGDVNSEIYTASMFIRRAGEGWTRVSKTLTAEQLREAGGKLHINPFGKLGVDWDSEAYYGGARCAPDGSPHFAIIEGDRQAVIDYSVPKKPPGYLSVSRASRATYWALEEPDEAEIEDAEYYYHTRIYEARIARLDGDIATARAKLCEAMQLRRVWLLKEKRRVLRYAPVEEAPTNLVLRSNDFQPGPRNG